MKKLFVIAALCLSGCLPADNGGGGGNTSGGSYYVNASGCQGYYGSYSYSGPSYSTCNYYYQLAAQSNCSKIYDNCR